MPPKHQKLLTQKQSITFHVPWIFSKATMRTQSHKFHVTHNIFFPFRKSRTYSYLPLRSHGYLSQRICYNPQLWNDEQSGCNCKILLCPVFWLAGMHFVIHSTAATWKYILFTHTKLLITLNASHLNTNSITTEIPH